jgi:putative sterol carrier protein
MVLGLRSLFDPERAGDLNTVSELRLGGTRFRVTIGGGAIELARGAAESPDLVIEGEAGDIAALITGQVPLGEALESGSIRIEGGRREAARFLRLFPMPEPCGGCAQAGAPEESGVAVTV